MSERNDAPETVIPEVLPMEGDPVPAAQKVKGAAQMAAGGALAAAGVPMLILPGPGAAAIVGGAALASKGQRNFSGRKAMPIEETLDDAAAKAAEMTKAAAKATAHNAADTVTTQAPIVAKKAAEAAPRVAKKIAKEAPGAAANAAKVAGTVAKGGAHVASKAARKAAVLGKTSKNYKKK